MDAWYAESRRHNVKCDVISKESRDLVNSTVVFTFLHSVYSHSDFRAIGFVPTLFKFLTMKITFQ